MSFSEDIRKWTKKVEGKEGAFLRQFSQELAFRIIDRTPVDTGFARASWYALINQDDGPHPQQPDFEEFQGKKNQQSGTVASIGLAISTAVAGDFITIANNANYIERLEDGSSQQAPSGMVKTTLNEAGDIAQHTIRTIL